jgi:hypothetical protein
MTPPQTGDVLHVGEDTLTMSETSADAVGRLGLAE